MKLEPIKKSKQLKYSDLHRIINCCNIIHFIGIVTTARLTHATPAALYAHSPHWYWECDAGLKRNEGYGGDDLISPGEENPNYNDTLDIARQLIYDETGIKANVILGGGLRSFKA